MQKVSYIGDGTTTDFFFNFPFFENSNVVVTINNTAATGYSIIGTSGGLDPDIPYIAGKVVFEIAPRTVDCITIARQLPLERIVDYQPLEKIDPTTLNQDLNYLMEVIKDRKDELSDLTTKYAEIADKESTEIILSRISAIHEEITDIDAKIQALGDIGTLQQRVTDLNTTVGGHTTSIATLNTQKSNIDMDNLSNTGKNTIFHMAMPSSQYIDINEPANGGSCTYTAPANGYIYYGRRKTGNNSGVVYIVNQRTGIELNAANFLGDTVCTVLMPVNQGDTCILGRKDLTGQLIGCRFYYALGVSAE